ncbi:ANTAR domain-containing protein [Nocardioides sp.]|uniref:ANTAR domain-containing protein n=1 Tax=Nocardioides sp. TaxID=35761 RepID=UPI0035131B27
MKEQEPTAGDVPIAPLPGRAAREAGRFVHHVTDDRWEWDDDVHALLGHRPGAVRPSTELLLSAAHEHDRELVADGLEHARSEGTPFTLYFRAVVGERVRRVVLVGEGEYDDVARVGGPADRLAGYYLDLTPELEHESAAAADAAVAASAAARDTIEQAKGILMLAYGLEPDAAFAMLRWWSRNRNVKVREVAERLIQVARDGHVSHPGLRRLLDALLDDLTARRSD